MSNINKTRLEAIEGGKNLIGSYRLTENYLWQSSDGRSVIIASRPLKSKGQPTFLLFVDRFGLRHYIASLEASSDGKGLEFNYYGDRYVVRQSKNHSITIGFLSQKVRLPSKSKGFRQSNTGSQSLQTIGKVKRGRNGYLTIGK